MSSNVQLLFVLSAILMLNILLGVDGIGINYGILGDNLPTPNRTIAVLKSRGITKIRIFTPNHRILNALRGSGIRVYIGTLNEDLPKLANDPSFAAVWVLINIMPYAKTVRITGISAGNEVEGGPLGAHLVGAMTNLDNALRAQRLRIPVTTVVSYGMMGSSYPPSNGSFSSSALEVMTDVAKFSESKQYPLLANIYPYFPYSSNPMDIKLDYALLKQGGLTVVTDAGNKYTNLLEAMVDALYSALEKVGAANVKVVVSETGWPNGGGPYASIANARQYNNNLAKRVSARRGTPKRPNIMLEAYIFAMYNENQKPAGVEAHWGLYYPSLKEVYHVEF